MSFNPKQMNDQEIYNQYMYSYPHKRAYDFSAKLDLSEYRQAFRQEKMGLYLHIPFCRMKCGYCNLFSVTGNQGLYQPYVQAMKRHSQQMKSEIDFSSTEFNSFILGGGTPLILSVDELEQVFAYYQKEYNFELKSIFSAIESSPTEITKEKLQLLQEYHWKRLSLGIQSFHDQELKLIERGESYANSIKALELIRNYDLASLNIDLIYGIPNQTTESFEFSIKQALVYQPEEIFLYPLYKQPNARLYHKFEMDYKAQYELYQMGRDLLLSQGYHQLSMRSFAKQKLGSADCGFENTLSLGCGGRSYFHDLHFCEPYLSEQGACVEELKQYIEKQDFLENLSYYKLNLEEQKRKYLIKNLLYFTGLSIADYSKQFGSDLWQDFPILQQLIDQQYAIRDHNRIYLTQLGMGLSDMIGPMFISDQVKRKMKDE